MTAPSPEPARASRDHERREPLAIVGVSGRFAESDDVDALWRHLAAGDDLVGPIERWDLSGYSQDELLCRAGSFIDGIDRFDARFFDLSGREATYTDPQQRLFLEQAAAALEDAGYAGASIDGRRCGVYVGCTGGDYTEWFDDAPPAQATWGNAPSIVPARIAYHLNLHGPAIAVDTACSSSAVAIHLACQGLWTGETELAVAGGVSIQTTPLTYLAASRAGMLSPTGRCHTFDARADGYVPGEGVGVVVLRRLSDALADGDHIHAVIRGSAINQDGATNGITAPSAQSQERLIRQVHDDFGVDPAEIGMLEAHGTGTQLGDPIECQALTSAFAGAEDRGYCALGSIKTNLGHTTSAAGVASLLKIVLSLRHEQIPPSLHYEESNPAIRLADTPFYVNTQLRPWQPNVHGRRVAAMSSFGFSGTNAHLVIEDAPPRAVRGDVDGGFLFVLSAPQPQALRQRAADLLAHLRGTPDIALGDVSYTLALGRGHFANRAAFVASGRDELSDQLERWLADDVNGAQVASGDAALDRARMRYLDGGTVDFVPMFTGRDVRRTPLPTYPFQRRRYWVATSTPARREGESTIMDHPATDNGSQPPAVTPAPTHRAPDLPARSGGDGIAVIGVAARFAHSPDAEALWAHLAAGDDLIDEVTRWDLTKTLGSDVPRQHGGFIDDIARFDAQFFSISDKEATYSDPQQRVFLEECWRALEDAGYAGERLDGRDCGVYVGAYPGDYHELMGSDRPPQTMWGNMASVIASRISYFLDLRGPALSVDSACSSSLVSIHMACQDLRLGITSMALAGGVFLQSTPRLYQYAARAGMLSASGRCHTFDARADGFVPGEGAGVVVLKRLDDALRDGDHVYGVIRASGVNQDGTTPGITAPSASAQERLLRGVYESAGVDPAGIQLVEAHGTGTPLGDPIEFGALCKAFADAPPGGCALGAVKANLGHSQFAAGVAGAIKVLLALEHQALPPAGHFTEPNPAITLEGSPFYINTALRPWPSPPAGPRRAAVSSFGASGTNAHMLIEQAPEPTRTPHGERSHWLLVLSAQDETARRTHVERMLAYALAHEDLDLGDVAYTLATGRRHGSHRWACVAADRAQWIAGLRTWLRDGRADNVFTGRVTGRRRREDPAARTRAEELMAEHDRRENLVELAESYVLSAAPRFAPLFGDGGFRPVPLPAYPFGGERHWVEPHQAEPPRVETHQADAPPAPGPSPLAGRQDHRDANSSSFVTELTGSEFFVEHHRVRNVPVLPGVAYLEMARAAAEAEGFAPTGMVLRNVVWSRPAQVTEPTTFEVALRRHGDGAFSYEVATADERAQRVVHGQGRIERCHAPTPARLDIAGLRARCDSRSLDHDACYGLFERMGISYGTGLRGVERLDVGRGLAVARVRVPQAARDSGAWILHPSMLDAGMQTTLGLALTDGTDEVAAALPFALDEIQMLAPSPASGWAVARLAVNDRGDTVRRVDIELCDDEGDVCVRLLGLSARVLPAPGAKEPASRGSAESDSASLVLMRADWRAAEPARTPQPLVRHEVLLGGLDAIDPSAVTAELGLPCAALPDADDLARRFTRHAETLLAQVQQAIPASRDGHVLVQVVVPRAGEDQLLSGLGGLLRTARYEHPKLMTQLIEVETPIDTVSLCARLRGDAASLDDATIRYVGGERLVSQWTAIDAAPVRRPWKAGGVYLITGGAGGLGALFAREIAQRAAGATLVLCGRSPAGEAQAELLRELHDAGASASYRALDVSERDEVTECVDTVVAEHGRLDGVIHSAGLLRDGYLAKKTPADLRDVLAAKVAGVVYLDEATAGLELDCFIGFSSLAASGNPGQADYAAANAFMDAYAVRREEQVARGERHGRTLVVGWPLWADGGMHVDAATERILRDSIGMLPMRAREGVEALERAYGSGAPHVMVVYGERARIEATLLAAPKSAVDPAVDPGPAVDPAADPPAESAVEPIVESAAAPDRATSHAAVLQGLTKHASDLLDVPTDEIDGAVDLSKHGFDSISLTEFTNALNTAYALSLTPTVLFEYPTLNEVADYLLDNHADRFTTVAPAAVPVGDAESVAPVPESVAPAPESVAPAVASAAPPTRAAQHAALLGRLTAHVSAVLGVPAEKIDGAVEMSEYGFDSISLTEFANALNEKHELALAPTLFFEYPTLSELADHLLDNHADSVAATPVQTAPQAPVEPAPQAPLEPAPTIPVESVPAVPAVARPAASADADFGASTAAPNEPVAVIGISGRFPMADDPAEFWRNLSEGRDCIREVPADRWDWRAYFGDPIKEPNTTNVKWGGFMDGVGDFDPLFFGISPKEAELMDPQQRLLMLYVWKALEDAGYAANALAGTDTAIVVGTTNTGYGTMVARHSAVIEGYDTTGAAPSMGPNRMSYFLDVHGPSEPIDTACSSSLVAIHRSIQALHDGQCDMAVAGGVNTLVSVDGHIGFSKTGMLSVDGRCKTFSDRADGYARGEGVGMLVLKRLSAAERDGDHIYGLVRSTAENHGGRANSLTSPNVKAQAALIRRAYSRVGIDPRTVGYIEAHGTGTELGDPVELNGLKAAFTELYAERGVSVGEAHCGVGSVKTNIGHLELAAGVAGVIKVLLQLRHRTLVESLHCETVNPYIDLTGSPFFLVRERQPWPALLDGEGRELPRRAGVSSFGFGGANAHVVLEEYRPRIAAEPDRVPSVPLPVVFSARHPDVLRDLVTRWVDVLRRGDYRDADLASVAYTSQTGRTAMTERLACLAGTVDELRERLESWLRGEPDDHVFTGQVRRDRAAPEDPAGFESQAVLAGDVSRERWARLLEAWVIGATVDWNRLHGERGPRRIPLPTYPFHLRRYWLDTSQPPRGQRTAVLHPLLHENTSDLSEQRYTSRFTGREFFLSDHRVRAVPVLPGVAYLEMARAAAVLAAGGDGQTWSLSQVAWVRPLTVENPTDVHLRLSGDSDGELFYEASTLDDQGDRLVHGHGRLRRRPDTPGERLDLAALRAQCDGPVLDADACYERFTNVGIEYGPTLRVIEQLHGGSRQAMARLKLRPAAAGRCDFVLHPSLLDAALQSTVGLFLNDVDLSSTALPFAVDEVDVLRATPLSGWALTRFAADDRPGAVRRLDIDLCDDDGDVCVRLRGYSMRARGEMPADAYRGGTDVAIRTHRSGQRRVPAGPDRRHRPARPERG